jgi:cytochrome c biogenesis protein CcmG/thiol:disulfide interchange protein DsbE
MKLNKNQSIKLIGLNYRDNLSNAKNFINEFGNPYSQILIDNEGILSVEFGAYGVPETFIIDKNKKIVRKFIGPITREIEKEINLIIK